ncbi:MAG: hypothetical protein IH946_03015, partial [Bacteroidetes bacterium]|nr:hypothetical protein [Bacteroidota bacterium]
MKQLIVHCSLLIVFCSLHTASAQLAYSLHGYLTDLRTFIPFKGGDSLVVDNLFHNRINFEATSGQHFGIRVEMRNRMFYGEVVRSIPDFGNFVNQDDNYVDLSFIALNLNSVVILSKFDRAYIEWFNEKWEFRLGRQR